MPGPSDNLSRPEVQYVFGHARTLMAATGTWPPSQTPLAGTAAADAVVTLPPRADLVGQRGAQR